MNRTVVLVPGTSRWSQPRHRVLDRSTPRVIGQPGRRSEDWSGSGWCGDGSSVGCRRLGPRCDSGSISLHMTWTEPICASSSSTAPATRNEPARPSPQGPCPWTIQPSTSTPGSTGMDRLRCHRTRRRCTGETRSLGRGNADQRGLLRCPHPHQRPRLGDLCARRAPGSVHHPRIRRSDRPCDRMG